nr:hypothetical protein [Arthrobacter antioxidans]
MDLKLSVEDQLGNPKPAAVSTINALSHHLPKLEKQHRASRIQNLLRGDVLEVQVELSPERSYQFMTAVSSTIDLIQGRAEIFGIEESAMAEVQQMVGLLSGLLVDLVPLQSRVTSHRLVIVDNISWLVDVSMITPDSALDRATTEVQLVGVTELPLYWKDVRRVLFAGSTYSVYARLSRPGIQTSWSPVKLADVFDQFLPDLGDQLRRLPYLFDSAHGVTDRDKVPVVSEVLCDNGLIPFGHDLAQLTSRNISRESLLEVAREAARSVDTAEKLDDMGIVRNAFEQVVKAVESCPPLTEPLEIDRHLVRTLRSRHQEVARLTFHKESAATEQPKTEEEHEPAAFLEAEVVAIYW